MSNLLALDQASKTSGYAVFINGELKYYGKFTCEDNDVGLRLVKIRDKIISLIEQYDINEVVCEDIQMQNNIVNNVITFKTLAEVLGVVKETLSEKKIKYSVVLAGTWKSTLGIKGAQRAEQKRNAQQFVFNTYGIKATQDESDAICIGTHAVKVENSSFNWD